MLTERLLQSVGAAAGKERDENAASAVAWRHILAVDERKFLVGWCLYIGGCVGTLVAQACSKIRSFFVLIWCIRQIKTPSNAANYCQLYMFDILASSVTAQYFRAKCSSSFDTCQFHCSRFFEFWFGVFRSGSWQMIAEHVSWSQKLFVQKYKIRD